ncbi:MAG: T9SS type A sorting domain-containing protein [Flavobacteriales bacterium]
MRTTPTLLLSILSVGTMAQCFSSIPGNAIVISTSGLVSATDDAFWVCAGASPTFSGNDNTIYVEAGVVCSVTGNDNMILTKSFLGVSGDNNIVYTESATTVLDQGTNNSIIECVSVTFNYANAPTNGCAVGIEETNANVQVQLMPNPVNDELTITSTSGNIRSVEVADLTGRVVRTTSGNKTVSVETGTPPTGVYLALIRTDAGTLMRRVVKE